MGNVGRGIVKYYMLIKECQKTLKESAVWHYEHFFEKKDVGVYRTNFVHELNCR